MRVLLIPESFPTDENPVAGIFMLDQIQALRESGAQVSLFNTNPFYRGVYQSLNAVRAYDFHLFRSRPGKALKIPAYKFWELQSIRLAKKMPPPDLIHLHGAGLRGKIATTLANYWNVPLVVTEHTGPWKTISDRPFIFRKVSKVLSNSDIVLPVSEHLKYEIIDSGIEANFKVLGNPVDTEFFTLRTKELTENRKILFLGRLDPFKGGLKTLQASIPLLQKHPNWKLVIAGEGTEENDIKQSVTDQGLESRVELRFAKHSRESMRELFHEASFLVFPSEFESFGLVGAEAMATGLPVVITNRTGPLDYANELNSIKVNPFEIGDINYGIESMMKSISEYSPSRIRASIHDRFSTSVYGDNLVKIYKELIQKKSQV